MKMIGRWLAFILSCGAGATVGYGVAIVFASGLKSPPPRAIEKFAVIQNVRLPAGARTMQDLKTFIIQLKGEVDDFARVYVNNRQIISNDDPKRPFQYITWNDGAKGAEHTERLVVHRKRPFEPVVDVRRWLRHGVNWIMVELENTRWGGCSMLVEFLANGTQLETSPQKVPSADRFDGRLANGALFERFRKLSAETSATKHHKVAPEGDAVCARMIFAFVLR